MEEVYAQLIGDVTFTCCAIGPPGNVQTFAAFTVSVTGLGVVEGPIFSAWRKSVSRARQLSATSLPNADELAPHISLH